MFIKTSDLGHLDVINIDDGRYLGNVCDVDWIPKVVGYGLSLWSELNMASTLVYPGMTWKFLGKM